MRFSYELNWYSVYNLIQWKGLIHSLSNQTLLHLSWNQQGEFLFNTLLWVLHNVSMQSVCFKPQKIVMFFFYVLPLTCYFLPPSFVLIKLFFFSINLLADLLNVISIKYPLMPSIYCWHMLLKMVVYVCIFPFCASMNSVFQSSMHVCVL